MQNMSAMNLSKFFHSALATVFILDSKRRQEYVDRNDISDSVTCLLSTLHTGESSDQRLRNHVIVGPLDEQYNLCRTSLYRTFFTNAAQARREGYATTVAFLALRFGRGRSEATSAGVSTSTTSSCSVWVSGAPDS